MRVRLALWLASAGSLFGQLEMVTEVRVTMGSGGQPNLARTERVLAGEGALRMESGESFVLYRRLEDRVYIGNGRERTYAVGTAREFLETIRSTMPNMASLSLEKISSEAGPAPPPIRWQGRELAGQSCKVRVELPGVDPQRPMVTVQTVQAYSTEMDSAVAAALSLRASIGLDSDGAATRLFMPNADKVSAAIRNCFPKDRLMVRMEMKVGIEGGTPIPLDLTMTVEVTKLARTKVDPLLLEIPQGWIRSADNSLARAWAVYAGVPATASAPAAATTAARRNRAELTKEELVKKAEELKSLIEAEKWVEAKNVQSELSLPLYTRAEAAAPPLSKQLADVETEIAGLGPGQTDGSALEQAARLALKIGDLAKVVKYSQRIVADGQTDGFLGGNKRHSAHTLLGLIAWREGRKQEAFEHLAASGKEASGPVVGIMGARLELAEKLAEAGEYERVAAYIEACRKGSSRPEAKEMYDRALEALKAKQRPYFGRQYDKYELPGDTGRP